MDAQQLKGHLDLLLLATLERGARYGGQIIADVQAATNGYIHLRAGTLYPALHRLEKAGWITGEFQALPRGGSPVKIYILTPSGRSSRHSVNATSASTLRCAGSSVVNFSGTRYERN